MRAVQLATLYLALVFTVAPSLPVCAQFEGLSEHEKDRALVEMLKWRNSDKETTARYLIVVSVAIALGYGIFIGHKRVRAWLRRRPRRRRWDESLGRHGLDPVERDFVASLAMRAGGQDPAELLRTRGAFERALGAVGVDLSNDPYESRTINAIRTKLGSDVPKHGEPIPSTQLLQPDQVLELFGIGQSAGYCLRTILVHCDPQHLMVRVLDRIVDLPWSEGQKVQAYFWRDNDAGYYFQTDILEVRQQRHVYLLLAHPVSLERKQKRMYVRAQHEFMFRFHAIPAANATHLVGSDAEESAYEREGWTEDISAGGFRFLTPDSVQIGDLISVPEFKPANGADVMATVVNDLGITDSGHHRYGVRFAGMAVPTREAITRFVFDAQRQHIREHLRSTHGPKSTTPAANMPAKTPAANMPVANTPVANFGARPAASPAETVTRPTGRPIMPKTDELQLEAKQTVSPMRIEDVPPAAPASSQEPNPARTND